MYSYFRKFENANPGDPKGLFEGQELASLNLPVEETPDMPYDPPSKWVSVESMGATGGDDTDDTRAIQAALNACDGKEKNTVYFRSPGEYYISEGLKVPAGVKRLIFFWGGRINSERLMPEDGSQFIIAEPSEDPVIFEDYFQHVNGNRGYFMDHAAERTVICRNFRGSRDFSNYKHTSPNRETRLFLENTCHMIGEGSWFDNVCYARWINTETADKVEFLNSGGRLWVLGYKCESAAINFRTVNGGYTEVLGGIINQYRSNDELYNASHVFELVDASGSFISCASGPDDHDYEVIVRETRNGETRTLLKTDFPVRENNKIHVPLFAGYVQGHSGSPLFPPELTRFEPHEKNPIFTAGADTAWDRQIRERGWIMKEDNEWRMYYTGYDGTQTGLRKLGLALSPDGIDWERASEFPLYDSIWVEDVCVIRHEDSYYLFAEGRPRAHWMTSEDGISWSPQGSLQIYTTAGEEQLQGGATPTVYIEEDGTWYLFYQNTGGVWMASSDHPRSWTNVKDEPVIRAGPEVYDRDKLATDQVFKYRGRYYMFYHGRSERPGPSPQHNTHLAVSDDLINWTKYPGNPVIGDGMSSGIVVHDGKGWRLYTMHDKVRLFWTVEVKK